MIKTEYWLKKIISKDLIYKKKISNNHKLINLKKICVKMNNNKTAQNIKNIFLSISIVEILTNQKSKISFTKKSISDFNIQKKSPVGCIVTLRKKNKEKFLQFLILFVFPKLDLKQIKKGLSFLNIGVENIYLLPQLSIINNYLLNSLGFSLSFIFDSNILFFMLSSLQLKK
jgi:large subunit ribosomal protein L5